jgi:hypothetical protein
VHGSLAQGDEHALVARNTGLFVDIVVAPECKALFLRTQQDASQLGRFHYEIRQLLQIPHVGTTYYSRSDYELVQL